MVAGRFVESVGGDGEIKLESDGNIFFPDGGIYDPIADCI